MLFTLKKVNWFPELPKETNFNIHLEFRNWKSVSGGHGGMCLWSQQREGKAGGAEVQDAGQVCSKFEASLGNIRFPSLKKVNNKKFVVNVEEKTICLIKMKH